MKYIIGVDVGGTSIRAGLVAKGLIISSVILKTEVNKGQKRVIDNIVRAITTLSEKIEDEIIVVGIGVPGVLDLRKGIIKCSPNLPFKDTPLASIISKRIGKQICVDNDANCFALAETRYGAAQNKRNVIGITLGTGVGSGLIIHGKVYHGVSSGPELGHTTINFNGPKANCNNNGCVEEYVSIRGILGRAKGLNIKTPKDLFELAEQGNKKAIKAWQETGFYLGIAAANFANAFDPDVIVIGGNIANAWKFFSKEMDKTVKKRALNNQIKVVKSKLGDQAGILGAACLCTS